jgi:hypothetical protein
VTGGTGGLGRAFARWLRDRGARHVVVTSRSGGDGAVAVDAADRDGMARLLARLDAPLAGVIHAAGVARWQLLADADAATLEETYRGKVHGALVLDELTRGLALDFFVLCSSVASLWGGRGQGVYASANQVLDALAHARRRRGQPALAIQFGLWAEGGMAPAHSDEGRALRAAGIVPMATPVALAAVERALAAGVTQRAIAEVDWPRFRTLFEARGPRPLLERLPAASSPPTQHIHTAFRDRIAAAGPAEARQMLTELVVSCASRVLAYAPDQTPPTGRGFFEIGMDSLMVTQMVQAVGAALGEALPTALAFDHPNIAALGGALADLLAPPPEDPSEDELSARLAAKLAQSLG